jgi:hypothetical protein
MHQSDHDKIRLGALEDLANAAMESAAAFPIPAAPAWRPLGFASLDDMIERIRSIDPKGMLDLSHRPPLTPPPQRRS